MPGCRIRAWAYFSTLWPWWLGHDYHELLRQAITAPLLLLDDVDKLKPSEFREETLYKLLNGRRVAELPLVLSSNSPPDALARWIGEAGRSRLMAGLIPVEMAGPITAWRDGHETRRLNNYIGSHSKKTV